MLKGTKNNSEVYHRSTILYHILIVMFVYHWLDHLFNCLLYFAFYYYFVLQPKIIKIQYGKLMIIINRVIPYQFNQRKKVISYVGNSMTTS